MIIAEEFFKKKERGQPENQSFNGYGSLHGRVDSADVIISTSLVEFPAPGLRTCEHG